MTVVPMAESVPVEREAEIREKVAEYVAAYEARDVDRILALFADDAEVTYASGTFRGTHAIRKIYEWDVELSPTARVRDSGVGVLVSDRTAVCERVTSLTCAGIPYEYEGVNVLEFDDAGLIGRLRPYYDKLALLDQIASRYPGIRGQVFRRLTGYLVAQGYKGLDVPAR